jgi:hypothetical protein
MRNKALHQRLVAIEAKSHDAAKAIERENRLAAERNISAEEAERVYRQLKATAPRSEDSRKLSLDQVMAEYFRMTKASKSSPGISSWN